MIAYKVLSVNTPNKLEILFAHLILADGSSLLLRAAYRPLVYLTDNLDDIMASYNCQNVVVVGDLTPPVQARCTHHFIF